MVSLTRGSKDVAIRFLRRFGRIGGLRVRAWDARVSFRVTRLAGLEAGGFDLEGGQVGAEHARDVDVGLARDLGVAGFGAHDRRLVHADLRAEHRLIHPVALPQLRDHVPDVPIDIHDHRKCGLGNRRRKRLTG